MRPQSVRFTFWILFFLSGAVGLVYEVVELRLIHLAIGTSSVSVYVVLSSFMAGMAVGSRIGGRVLDRVERPLLAFAALELGVGILSVPFFYVGRWGGVLGSLFTPELLKATTYLPFWRAFLVFLFLLPPAAFMGATLPALSRHFLKSGLKGLEIGRLYALNTFGAVLGCFLTGFFLIDQLGVFGTLSLAVFGSFMICALALWVGRKSDRVPVDQERIRNQGRGTGWLLPSVFAMSGMCALAAETVWTRILKFTLRTDVYAFSIMLSLFLACLALGAALAAPVVRKIRRPALGLALLQGWIAVATLLSLRLFRSVATTLGPGGSLAILEDLPGALVKTAALMLLPVAGYGAVFPLMMQLGADTGSPASSTGRLMAANTAGAAAGAVVAGFLLIPLAGTAGSLAVLACVNFVLALAMAWNESKRARYAFAAVAGLPLILLPYLNSAANPYLLPVMNVDSGGLRPDRKLLWFGEGYDVTAGIFQDTAGIADPEFKSLNINGISYSATSFRSRRYMKFLSYLPAYLHGQPKQILVLCMGTGITAGAAAGISGVTQVDIVELSPTVLKALPVFRTETRGLESRQNVRIIVDDGRNFLQSGWDLYDIITAEPPPPREAGVVSLYTREYYEILKRRLAPGGIAVQWVPLSGQSVEESKSLVATFMDAFPEISLWLPTSTQLVLIGSVKSMQTDPATGEQLLFGHPESRSDLHSVGFRSAEDLLSVFLAEGPQIQALVSGAARVTDASPVVEYFRRFGHSATGDDFISWLGAFRGEAFHRWARKNFTGRGYLSEIEQKLKLEALIRHGDWRHSVPLLEYALSLDTNHLYLRRDLAITGEQRKAARNLRAKHPYHPNSWDIDSRLALRAKDMRYAETILLQAMELFPEDMRFSVRLSDLYRHTGRLEKARDLLKSQHPNSEIQNRLRIIELLALPESTSEQQFELGERFRLAGEWENAARIYRSLLEIDPLRAGKGISEIENPTARVRR